MPVPYDELYKRIEDAFPGAKIELEDLRGDQDHYSVHITSEVFAGQSRVAQHKLVHKALEDILGDQLHALAIQTSAA